MPNLNSLYIYEEILLLALRDKEGTLLPMVNYPLALGGALLAELLMSRTILLEAKRKSKYITLNDEKLSGDLLLDECIEKIKQAKRKATMPIWISRFARIKNLKHRVAQKLCQRGILQASEDTILLIFKRKIYPQINPQPEQKIIQRLRQVIFSTENDIDPRTIVLLSLAKSVNLLSSFLSKDEQKSQKKRIEQIVNGEIAGKATKEAIEAMEAAVMLACIMPAVMASTVHH